MTTFKAGEAVILPKNWENYGGTSANNYKMYGPCGGEAFTVIWGKKTHSGVSVTSYDTYRANKHFISIYIGQEYIDVPDDIDTAQKAVDYAYVLWRME